MNLRWPRKLRNSERGCDEDECTTENERVWDDRGARNGPDRGRRARKRDREKERERERGGVYTFALYHLLSWFGSFFFLQHFPKRYASSDKFLRFSTDRRIELIASLGCISDLSLDKFDIDFLQIRASYVIGERKAKNRLHGRRQTRRTNFHPSICSRGELKIRRNSFTYRDDSRDPWQRRNTTVRRQGEGYLVAVLNSLRHFSFVPRR